MTGASCLWLQGCALQRVAKHLVATSPRAADCEDWLTQDGIDPIPGDWYDWASAPELS